MKLDLTRSDQENHALSMEAKGGLSSETIGFNPTLRPTLRWLQELMGQCPNWQAQWLKRLHGKQDLTSKAFFQHYHYLAQLIDAMPVAYAVSTSALKNLEQVLVAQFPMDPAWKNAVRHRSGMIRSKDKPRKHGAAYLPRILAERRNAVVIIRNPEGEWQSQKSVKAAQILFQSGQERRAFLETLMSIPSLKRIEIPAIMDFTGAAAVAAEVRDALAGQNQATTDARKIGRNWNLALRRIRSMGLNGCFDSATQTVIVDPRHMESMKHEVCHWLLDHGTEAHTEKRFSYREGEAENLEKELFTSSHSPLKQPRTLF